MEDWRKCQISPFVKYRQNQTKTNVRNSEASELILQCYISVWTKNNCLTVTYF